MKEYINCFTILKWDNSTRFFFTFKSIWSWGIFFVSLEYLFCKLSQIWRVGNDCQYLFYAIIKNASLPIRDHFIYVLQQMLQLFKFSKTILFFKSYFHLIGEIFLLQVSTSLSPIFDIDQATLRKGSQFRFSAFQDIANLRTSYKLPNFPFLLWRNNQWYQQCSSYSGSRQ